MNNHRWTERVPYRLKVVLHYPALGFVVGRTRNISENGMFVETPCPVESFEEQIDISFALPTLSSLSTTQVTARVVHRSDNGVGLQFDNMSLPLSV